MKLGKKTINLSPAQQKKLAYAFLLGAMLLWGLSFVVIKVGLNEGLTPMTFNALRFLISAAIIFPLFKIAEPKTRLQKKHIPAMLLAGVFGVALYYFCETTGVLYTSASNASLIIASIPIFTLLSEVVFFKKKAVFVQAAGIVLSMAGVYLLIAHANGSNLASGMKGNLLMLGACLSWVAYVAVTRTVVHEYSGLALTTFQIVFGAVMLCPFALLEMKNWRPITPLAWGCILFLAATCSVLAYAAYNYALKHLGSIVVSAYLNLLPVVTVAAGMLFLSEHITLAQGIGGVVVIASILLVNSRESAAHTESDTPAPPHEY